MALWVCTDCATAYSVDAPRCPHCGSTSYRENDDMPKSTVSSGASNGREGADDLSAGTSSSTPPGSSEPSLAITPSGPPRPARTTGNPSETHPPASADPGASSTAPSTDGSTPATGSSRKSSDVEAKGGVTLKKPGASDGQ